MIDVSPPPWEEFAAIVAAMRRAFVHGDPPLWRSFGHFHRDAVLGLRVALAPSDTWRTYNLTPPHRQLHFGCGALALVDLEQIVVSSVRVNGAETMTGGPFDAYLWNTRWGDGPWIPVDLGCFSSLFPLEIRFDLIGREPATMDLFIVTRRLPSPKP